MTVLAAVFAHEVPDGWAAAGIAVSCAGLTGVALWGLRGHRPNWAAIGAALATGLTIAAYTVVDGLGVRASGSALGYIAWLMAVEGVAVPAYALYRWRGQLLGVLRPFAGVGLLGAALSVAAYGLVLWAQTKAELAPVAALARVVDHRRGGDRGGVLQGAVRGAAYRCGGAAGGGDRADAARGVSFSPYSPWSSTRRDPASRGQVSISGQPDLGHSVPVSVLCSIWANNRALPAAAPTAPAARKPREERQDSTDHRDCAENNDPVLSHDPVEISDRAEPIEPTDRALPIEPIDKAEPTDPTDSTEPTEPIDNTES